MPVWRRSLRARGYAGDALHLPLPGMPETIGLGPWHVAVCAAGWPARDTRCPGVLGSQRRQRTARPVLLLPDLRIAPVTRAVPTLRHGHHQGGVVRCAGRCKHRGAYLGIAQAAGHRHSAWRPMFRRGAGLGLFHAKRDAGRPCPVIAGSVATKQPRSRGGKMIGIATPRAMTGRTATGGRGPPAYSFTCASRNHRALSRSRDAAVKMSAVSASPASSAASMPWRSAFATAP